MRPLIVISPALLLALAAAAILAGCAAPGAVPAGGTPTGTPPASASPPPVPVVAPPPPVAARDVSANGTAAIEFEKSGTALGDDARRLIGRLADRAKAAQRIAVTGYADRAQLPNAREAAVARAMSVRNELVRVGVPAARIRVKYVTSDPRNAAEITLEEARARR